jgi:hypothetical protein
MGLLSLQSRWFRHHPKEDCHDDNILARPSEEWWMITTVIITDVPVDVVSPVSSRAAIVATPELLLECRTQLHQLLSLLLELPL